MKYFPIITLIFLSSCVDLKMEPDEHTEYFYFKNSSIYPLRVYLALGWKGNHWTVYPDTVLPYWQERDYYKASNSKQHESTLVPFSPGEQGMVDFVNGRRRDYLNHMLPYDTLSVFIVHDDTLDKYGYDDVRQNNRLLVRYDLSIDEVVNLNYTFEYPPTRAMTDMKMWPAYGQVISNYSNIQSTINK